MDKKISNVYKVYYLEPLLQRSCKNDSVFHYCSHYNSIFYYDERLKMISFDNRIIKEIAYAHKNFKDLSLLKCYVINSKHTILGGLEDNLKRNRKESKKENYDDLGEVSIFTVFTFFNGETIKNEIRSCEFIDKLRNKGFPINHGRLVPLKIIYLFRTMGENFFKMMHCDFRKYWKPIDLEKITESQVLKIETFQKEIINFFENENAQTLEIVNPRDIIEEYLEVERRFYRFLLHNDNVYTNKTHRSCVEVYFTFNLKDKIKISVDEPI
eukprot:GAHX01004441.1.p1 GENE.GAHX01004441.1~~GAHX01004441.1.p1  ORF type:complete len:269 (-),score=36.41 GAHX01004441.1:98-904(-)